MGLTPSRPDLIWYNYKQKMIKNAKLLKTLEKEKLSYKTALKIFEALWKEAVTLNVLPSRDPLEGIDVDVRIARILNSCLKTS